MQTTVHRARVVAINDAHIEPAARFLHAHLNSRVAVDAWASAMRQSWVADAPNHGYLLYSDDEPVGVHLAFYSQRDIRGRVERFCNLGAWCVLPAHRRHSLRLLKALLAQDGYHFTDFSPSGAVVPMNERLGFRHLDTTASLVPALPWPLLPSRVRITSDSVVLERNLSSGELEVFERHRHAPAAKHLVLESHGEHCYVIFRKDRRKGLPLFASLLHVSSPDVLRRSFRHLSRHLLAHHGVMGVLAEHRIVGHRPLPSFTLPAPRPKMFKSHSLQADDIDYLCSELVSVPW